MKPKQLLIISRYLHIGHLVYLFIIVRLKQLLIQLTSINNNERFQKQSLNHNIEY